MKRTLIILIFLSISAISANAQHKKRRAKVRAYKISYITEKLNLTPIEAEKFWPLYNQYDQKMMKLHREERLNIKKRIKESGGIDNISEKESEGILIKIRKLNKERYTIKAKFHEKIATVLPFKKILSLEMAEHDFHRNLISKLKRRKK